MNNRISPLKSPVEHRWKWFCQWVFENIVTNDGQIIRLNNERWLMIKDENFIVPLLYPNCQIQAFCTSMKLYELQLVRHYASRYTEYGLWGSRYLNRILKRILPQMARHKSLVAWLAVCSRYDPSVGLPTTQLKFKSTKAQIHEKQIICLNLNYPKECYLFTPLNLYFWFSRPQTKPRT